VPLGQRGMSERRKGRAFPDEEKAGSSSEGGHRKFRQRREKEERAGSCSGQGKKKSREIRREGKKFLPSGRGRLSGSGGRALLRV